MYVRNNMQNETGFSNAGGGFEVSVYLCGLDEEGTGFSKK